MRILSCLFIGASVLSGADWVSERISAEALAGVRSTIPIVKNDRVVTMHLATNSGHPFFSVYGLDGKLLARFRVDVPGASDVFPSDITPLSDGSGYVAAVTAVQGGRRSALLAFVDAAGNLQKLVKTTPFLALRLATTADGTVWALGDIVSRDGVPNSPEPILYRFSKDGSLLGKSLPRNRFRTISGMDDPHPVRGMSFLLANGNRIGLWVSHTEEWIEFDPSGEIARSVMARLPEIVRGGKPTGVSNSSTGMAMTSDGSVYTRLNKGDQVGIYRLHPETAEWRVAVGQEQLVLKGIHTLWGAAGDQLVIGLEAPSGLLDFRLLTTP